MKIVRCSKCGKYFYKVNKCFYCGDTSEINEVRESVIHDNAAAQYYKMESLIENRNFEEALSLFDRIIEWIPDNSSAFWLHLLAEKKCETSTELLIKGIDIENNSSFYNALKLADEEEKSFYVDIKNIMIELKKKLEREIPDNEYRCKRKMKLLEMAENEQREIDSRKRKLYLLWSDLEKIECELYREEMNYCLCSQEYKKILEEAAHKASSIKAEVYEKFAECSESEFYKYQIEIGSVVLQSEQAKSSLEIIKKQHPWMETINALLTKRDHQVQLIGNELSSLKSYEGELQQKNDEIEKMEKTHREALGEVKFYNFQKAFDLLKEDEYQKILNDMGLKIDEQIFRNKKYEDHNTVYFETVDENDNDNENMIDEDNYYNIWENYNNY